MAVIDPAISFPDPGAYLQALVNYLYAAYPTFRVGPAIAYQDTGAWALAVAASMNAVGLSPPLYAVGQFATEGDYIMGLVISAGNPSGGLFIDALPPTQASVAAPFSFQMNAVGGTPPYIYSVPGGALPDGVGLNTTTGLVSGTPITVQVKTGIVITVTDSLSVSSSTLPFAINVNASPAGGVTAIQLSPATIPSGTTTATRVGFISVVNSPLTGYSFTLLDTISGHLQILNSNELWTVNGTSFDINVAATHNVSLKAQAGNVPPEAPTDGLIEQTALLTVTGNPDNGPLGWATYRADYVANTFAGGAAISDINCNSGQITSTGVISNADQTAIQPYSMDTSNTAKWGVSGSGISGSAGVTLTDASGTFKLCEIANSAFGNTWFANATVGSRTAGSVDTIRLRFGQAVVAGVLEPITCGYRIKLDGDGSLITNSTNLLGAPTSNGISANVNILSTVTGSLTDPSGYVHNYIEIVLQITRGSSSVPKITFETYTSGYMEVWGAQCIEGPSGGPWYATAATTATIPGTTFGPVSGSLQTLMNATNFTLVGFTNNVQSAFPGTILTNGATTGLEHTLLSAFNFCQAQIEATTPIRAGSGTSTAASTNVGGGWWGIGIWGITSTATGYSFSFNGSTVFTSGTPLTAGAKRVLLRNVQCLFRALYGDTTAVSSAVLQRATTLGQYSFTNAGLALNPGFISTTFGDDYTTLTNLNDIVRTRPAPYTSFPTVSNPVTIAQYQQTGSAGPNGRAMLMPRYASDTSPSGSGQSSNGFWQQINGEYEMYWDQQWPFPSPGPPTIISKHTDGSLLIQARLVANMNSAVQAAVPPRVVNQTTTGVTLPYISAAFTTAASFSQLGGCFEIQATFPVVDVSWPAFWLLSYPYGQAEIDWIEIFGTNRAGFTASTFGENVHANSYAYNFQNFSGSIGVPFNVGIHSVVGVWDASLNTMKWYVNGRQFGPTYSYTSAQNFNNSPAYMLINFAMGGNGIGAPAGTLDGAADGLGYYIYQVSAAQFNV